MFVVPSPKTQEPKHLPSDNCYTEVINSGVRSKLSPSNSGFHEDSVRDQYHLTVDEACLNYNLLVTSEKHHN